MNKTKTEYIQNTALLFILIAPLTIGFYASYLFNPENSGTLWLYLLQLLADGIAIANIGALWLTILLDLVQPEYHKRNLAYDTQWLVKNPLSVDVLIPVANEPYEVIAKTVTNVVGMDYPHKTYILDDGNSKDVKALANALGIAYIARPAHAKSYAKSGNINYGLKECHGEIFAIFDADHVPEKEFLKELLPFFQNKNVALVQTPQHYVNTDNFIAAGTAQAQEVFYKYVQPAKNSYNASFCVGTNMLYRRTAINKAGGIALVNHSEDIWTTLRLHERGYESVFYNKILAKGQAPETIAGFFRQQNRWARGGFSLFFKENPLFISGLSLDQRLQYFFSNMHYFTAFSILIYLSMPIIYLLFGVHPMDVLHPKDWAVHYLPYFITIYFLPLFLLGNFRLATICTSIASFYPCLLAFFSVVFQSNYTWIATGVKRKSLTIIMSEIWLHVFIILLSILAIFVGWYNVTDVTTTLITTLWAVLNAYFLFIFVKNGIVAEK